MAAILVFILALFHLSASCIILIDMVHCSRLRRRLHAVRRQDTLAPVLTRLCPALVPGLLRLHPAGAPPSTSSTASSSPSS